MHDPLTTETVDLLRDLIRASCVNDGSPASGQEHRAVAVIERYLHGSGLVGEVVEPLPGRTSLVVRLKGHDPAAPSLLLMGHLDVVPVHGEWSHDPFAADLVDGVVWGRGALDMLHLTASYAAVIKKLATDGTRLAGDVVFAAVADEEAGGRLGARWLVENRPELIAADGVLTESGGVPLAVDGAVRGVTVTVGEKGLASRRVVTTGHPRHASTPYGSSNAVVTAADAVLRIVAHPNPAVVDDLWPQYVAALDLPDDVRAALVEPARLEEALPAMGGLAGLAHAVTHTTIAPDIIAGGDKINVIPSYAEVQLDVRTLPGVTGDDVDRLLRAAIAPLGDRARVDRLPSADDQPASRSALDTRLFRALSEAVTVAYPQAAAVPVVAPGGSDGRFFRALGVPTYGFGLLSDRWHHEDFRRLIHSTDERIDVESVDLTVHALERIVRRVTG
ncbi:M20/M25/M40 family metallo-hydrolase [Frigoribacterium sp. 2-23]|uniref:M20/M25/M40 family metallo-hydrolase n=1 Tax=Frigoribacterium sp. 2-23 TaxID=3415006 RepID=UPI003C70601D